MQGFPFINRGLLISCETKIYVIIPVIIIMFNYSYGLSVEEDSNYGSLMCKTKGTSVGKCDGENKNHGTSKNH